MASVRLLSICLAGRLALHETPDSMKAAVLVERKLNMSLDYDNIDVVDVSVQKPGIGEVLIEVRGSSVNPVDMQLVRSPLKWIWSYPHPMGFDVSGVVVSHGVGCSSRLAVGDEVYAQMGTLVEGATGGGAWAEYAVVAERVLAKKPSNLNFTEAGTLPMVALTGLLNLRWAADPSTQRLDNMTVVVLGGSGGTGHVGIQLAKALGAAEVITTCSPHHFDFVKSLGADRAFDYHDGAEQWYDALPDRSVDVVYDCIGHGKNILNAFPKVKQNGRYASLTPEGPAGKEARKSRSDVKQRNIDCLMGCVQHANLEDITDFVEAGSLKVHLDSVFDLLDTKAAIAKREEGHATGKIAIVPGAKSLLSVI